ncbi:MAG: hypothetical protein JJT85_08810 [Chromatiales bacterium]|nr:hypothetical protein [Chromatiales bacterium]
MTLPRTAGFRAPFGPLHEDPDPAPTGSDDPGRRWLLGSYEDTRDAAVRVAGLARRGLAILTPDLEPGIYDSEAFLEITKKLVLSKRYARVRVLISDPARTVRNGNRLVALGRRLNTYIEFRNVDGEHRDERSAFLLADDRALLYRADARSWEGIADIADGTIARRYLERFEEIWSASETAKEIRQLRI